MIINEVVEVALGIINKLRGEIEIFDSLAYATSQTAGSFGHYRITCSPFRHVLILNMLLSYHILFACPTCPDSFETCNTLIVFPFRKTRMTAWDKESGGDLGSQPNLSNHGCDIHQRMAE